MKRYEMSAAILAGGLGKRMGGKKKLNIKINDKTLFDHTLLQLEGFEEIILSYNEKYETTIQIIQDEYKKIGPIGGLHSVLSNINNEVVLILASDMPMIESEFLDCLIELYDNQDALVCRTTDGKIHPLVGIYHKRILPNIEQFINNKNHKLMMLLEEVNTTIIDIKDEYTFIFTNLNTPDDILQIETELKHGQ